MLKRSEHTPAHLLVDNKPYFITAAIYKKRMLLAGPDLKEELIGLIRKNFADYDWELHQWVILDNHYHLMGKSRRGKDLPAIIRNIHRASAFLILDATKCEKPVWWNYWDYCPREKDDNKDYMIRLTYLLANPVRHGYTKDLKAYPFSGFYELYAEKGREHLSRQFRKYKDYKTLVLHEALEDDF